MTAEGLKNNHFAELCRKNPFRFKVDYNAQVFPLEIYFDPENLKYPRILVNGKLENPRGNVILEKAYFSVPGGRYGTERIEKGSRLRVLFYSDEFESLNLPLITIKQNKFDTVPEMAEIYKAALSNGYIQVKRDQHVSRSQVELMRELASRSNLFITPEANSNANA